MLGVLRSYKRQLSALFGMPWWENGKFEYSWWWLSSMEFVGWLFRTFFLFFFCPGFDLWLWIAKPGQQRVVGACWWFLASWDFFFILTEGLKSPFVSFSWELSHASLVACWSEGQCGDSSFFRSLGLKKCPWICFQVCTNGRASQKCGTAPGIRGFAQNLWLPACQTARLGRQGPCQWWSSLSVRRELALPRSLSWWVNEGNNWVPLDRGLRWRPW